MDASTWERRIMGFFSALIRAIRNPRACGAWPPGHFYSPIPDIAKIDTSGGMFDRSVVELLDVQINTTFQLSLLRSIGEHWHEIPEGGESLWRYDPDNDQFGLMDAYVLLCMLLYYKPASIIEIGSGHSSALMLDTIDLQHRLGSVPRVTFIDPHPARLEGLLRATDAGRARILSVPVQEVPLELFSQLAQRDVLFIDSSHVSKVGSDVNHIFFNIIPRLPKGVIVHIHDVFYPFEYEERWIMGGRFWNESYLVRSFLAYNSQFRIIMFNDYLWRHHPDAIEKYMPNAQRHSGSSLWIERI
jgi:hypothetical protein